MRSFRKKINLSKVRTMLSAFLDFLGLRATRSFIDSNIIKRGERFIVYSRTSCISDHPKRQA